MTDFALRFNAVLDLQPIALADRELIQQRYVHLVTSAENGYFWARVLYILLTNVVTIAGISITALVPLEKLSLISDTGSKVVFWFIWSLSIALTLANKWLHTFNIPKKYILGRATLEKLYSEGWIFLGGVGPYKNADPSTRTQIFITRIEKIRIKSVGSSPDAASDGAATDMLATAALSPRQNYPTPRDMPPRAQCNLSQVTSPIPRQSNVFQAGVSMPRRPLIPPRDVSPRDNSDSVRGSPRDIVIDMVDQPVEMRHSPKPIDRQSLIA